MIIFLDNLQRVLLFIPAVVFLLMPWRLKLIEPVVDQKEYFIKSCDGTWLNQEQQGGSAQTE